MGNVENTILQSLDFKIFLRRIKQSETPKMQALPFCFLCQWAPIRRPCSQAFLAETVETGDKNSNDFHCIQISLVMSMRFIYGDD